MGTSVAWLTIRAEHVDVLVLGLVAAFAVVRLALRYYFPPDT